VVFTLVVKKTCDSGSRNTRRQSLQLTSDKGLASDRASTLHNGSSAIGGHLQEKRDRCSTRSMFGQQLKPSWKQTRSQERLPPQQRSHSGPHSVGPSRLLNMLAF
jgi:hypothetical protein